MFANPPDSTTNKPRSFTLQDTITDMKSTNSSNRNANKRLSVSVNAGAITLILVAGLAFDSGAAPVVTQTNTLTMGAASKGDLTNGVLIVNTPGAGGTLTTAQIFADVKNGFNGGAWDGLGSLTAGNIYSSNAAALYPMALGYGDNSLLNYATFAGKATPLNTEAFVRYTYYGDNDLQGGVTADDFNLLLDGVNGVGTGWTYGDYDYNGVTNGDDLNLFLDGYNASQIGGPLPPLLVGDGGKTAASLVPEPSSIGLLAMGVLGLFSYRRKSH